MKTLGKNSAVENNNILRQKMKKFRSSLTDEDVIDKSKKIQAAIETELSKHDNQEIESFLCYYPLEKEVNLLDLYHKLLQQGKRLYFPVTIKEDILFYEVNDMDSFSEGAFHVMEPTRRDYLYENEAAIAIVPGLAFDKEMNRMGYGRGYYDRFFDAHPKVIKWAVAFQEQIVQQLSVNEWDVPMNQIFTD